MYKFIYQIPSPEEKRNWRMYLIKESFWLAMALAFSILYIYLSNNLFYKL